MSKQGDTRMGDQIHYDRAKAEKALNKAGAKIADANEIAEEIGDLSREAEEKLTKAQQELSELYIDMGAKD